MKSSTVQCGEQKTRTYFQKKISPSPISSPGRARTYDIFLNREALYRLSYRGSVIHMLTKRLYHRSLIFRAKLTLYISRRSIWWTTGIWWTGISPESKQDLDSTQSGLSFGKDYLSGNQPEMAIDTGSLPYSSSTRAVYSTSSTSSYSPRTS